MNRYVKIHPDDNVLVALTDLRAGEKITFNGSSLILREDVQAKHKFVLDNIPAQGGIIMYGVLVGKAVSPIEAGRSINTANVKHEASGFTVLQAGFKWKAPDVSRWKNSTFMGFHRKDGQVGTANYWLVIPMVFCENRNVDMIRKAFEEELGFAQPDRYKSYVHEMVKLYQQGKTEAIHLFRL